MGLIDITSIIKQLLGEKFTNIIGKGLDKAIDNIEFIMNNNILEYLSEEYNRNLYVKTLLHRATPVNLFDIYQPLYITPSRNWYKQSSRNRVSTASIKELFKEQQYIILKGTAGSGKSTIIKYLFLNAIQTKFKIPIKIELRYLNDYNGNIIEYIQDKIFKFQGLANSHEIIEKLMQSGDFVFFLDGYDEIVSIKKQDITKEVDDLVKKYSKNNYILTSRPFTDIDMLPLFHNYDVCDLSDADIDEFIIKQIPQSEKELSHKIIEAVHNQENKDYKSFLSNPLLLSMFVLTFQSYSSIPQRRSDFYNQVFETLFSLHDSVSKMAFVREKQSGLSKENIVEILKLFSFISYFDEKFIFPLQYLNEKLQLIKNKKRISFENQKLIQDLQIAIGILSQEGSEYTFPHRSLQEYFAAIYIISLSEDNKATIYSKIHSSLIMGIKRIDREYDNFYLLLSELDKRGTIKYVIIPFLSNAINIIHNITDVPYKEIIDFYVILKNTYSSFNNILLEKHILICEDTKFNKYYHDKITQIEKESKKLKGKQKNKSQEKEREKIDYTVREQVREEIAKLQIIPFLQEFANNIERTKERLNYYLISEEAIDADFINLA